MGLLDRFRRRTPGPGSIPLRVGDPGFDDWPVVESFGELASARAWCQHLQEIGIEAVLTSDWALDRFDRGDIALRVPPDRWAEASDAVGEEP
jgi:hypothetical protein